MKRAGNICATHYIVEETNYLKGVCLTNRYSKKDIDKATKVNHKRNWEQEQTSKAFLSFVIRITDRKKYRQDRMTSWKAQYLDNL